MAINGYRITEDGQSRTTESSIFRVTERFFEAAINLVSTTNTIIVVPKRICKVAVMVTASSSLLAAGSKIKYAATLVANSSSISVTPIKKAGGSTNLQAIGSTANFGLRRKYGYSNSTASSTLAAGAIVIKFGQINSGVGDFSRNTESEGVDLRITENGDVRIVSNTPYNAIIGSMIVDSTETPFASELKIKQNETWKSATTYVKYNGEWKLPLKGYKNINGIWKRIQ